MRKYKVIRTYDEGKTTTKNLQEAFDSGYEFLRASEYVPQAIDDRILRYGYIEYILVKEVPDDRD